MSKDPRAERERLLDPPAGEPVKRTPRNHGLRGVYAAVYLAAAVVVLTAFIVLLNARRDASDDGGFSAMQFEVDRLAQRAHDLKRWNWKPGSDPKGSGIAVNGEVVWSSAEQRGFMVLHGLTRNDATVERYQLWIFDKARDERYPVDGGVFDCTESDAIVPIAAKIDVTEPTLFTVTVERPGGVVVSDRSRIAALAGP